MKYIRTDNIEVIESLSNHSKKYNSLYVGDSYRMHYIKSALNKDMNRNDDKNSIFICFVDGVVYEKYKNYYNNKGNNLYIYDIFVCKNVLIEAILNETKTKKVFIYIDDIYISSNLCELVSEMMNCEHKDNVKITMALDFLPEQVKDIIKYFDFLKILSNGHDSLRFDEIGGIETLLNEFSFNKQQSNEIERLIEQNHNLEYVFVKGINDVIFMNTNKITRGTIEK